jgi:hypothetical protein
VAFGNRDRCSSKLLAIEETVECGTKDNSHAAISDGTDARVRDA